MGNVQGGARRWMVTAAHKSGVGRLMQYAPGEGKEIKDGGGLYSSPTYPAAVGGARGLAAATARYDRCSSSPDAVGRPVVSNGNGRFMPSTDRFSAGGVHPLPPDLRVGDSLSPLERD